MTTDPSWLFSTIAQSSAAIVAIIAGFITHSVLTLAAEKRNLINQRKEKNARLDTLKRQEKAALEDFDLMMVNTFLSEIAADLKEGEELPSLEELIRDNPKWQLNYEILNREYKNLSIRKIEARDFIEQLSDKIVPKNPLSFREWFRVNKLDISAYDYDFLENEYNRILDYKKKDLAEERRRRTSNWPWLHLPDTTDLLLNYQLRIPPISSHFKEERRIEELNRRIAGLRYEIAMIESETKNLNSRLKAFSYPPNLRLGAGVLGYLAIAGILLPVQIIANEAFFDWARKLALISFGTGIIAIFAYIVYQIRTLRSKNAKS